MILRLAAGTGYSTCGAKLSSSRRLEPESQKALLFNPGLCNLSLCVSYKRVRTCSLTLLPAPRTPYRAGSSLVSKTEPIQSDPITYYRKIKLEVTCPNVPGCKLQQFNSCFMSTLKTLVGWLGTFKNWAGQGPIISLIPRYIVPESEPPTMQLCGAMGFHSCSFKTGVWLGLYSLQHPRLMLWMWYGNKLNDFSLHLQNRQQKNCQHQFSGKVWQG